MIDVAPLPMYTSHQIASGDVVQAKNSNNWLSHRVILIWLPAKV